MNKFLPYLQKIEQALTEILPKNASEVWQVETFGKIFRGTDISYFDELIKPCNSLVESGGKRWRPLLLVLCAENAAIKNTRRISEENTYLLASLVEFVHTASLIHDDIEDSAKERRGNPSVHISYGMDVAINAGTWLYFLASCCIKKMENNTRLSLYELYTQELRRLHLGQAMDIFWHKNVDVFPTVESYTAMVRYKTGTLASLAVKIGTFAGGGSNLEIENAGSIASEIGEAFQILDDVQNLTTGNPGKKRGDDIVEGKKGLPVLLHIEKNPSDKVKIANLFEDARLNGINSSAIEECISLFNNSGAIQEAYEKGKTLVRQKSKELASIYTNDEFNLIYELFDSMLEKMEPGNA